MGEKGVVLEYKTEITLVHGNLRIIFTIQKEFPLVRFQESCDQSERGRFPASTWSKQGNELTLLDLKIEVLQDRLLIIGNRYIVQTK